MEINQEWIDQQRAVSDAANERLYSEASENAKSTIICSAFDAALDALEAAQKEIARLTDERDAANKPLTLPALFDLADDDAAWVVSENGKIWAMGAECAQEWASEERCLFFANKPTNADIAAARKERT